MSNLILTDCDGVLLDWEFYFHEWMKEQGHVIKNPLERTWDMRSLYDLTPEQIKIACKTYNESIFIRHLPPLRDAVKYVRLLHEECGFVFDVITSMGTNSFAQEARKQNLYETFGRTVFRKILFTDIYESKEPLLKTYEGSGYTWVEDKLSNAMLGEKLGLNPIVVEHNYTPPTKLTKVVSWREIYEMHKNNYVHIP